MMNVIPEIEKEWTEAQMRAIEPFSFRTRLKNPMSKCERRQSWTEAQMEVRTHIEKEGERRKRCNEEVKRRRKEKGETGEMES